MEPEPPGAASFCLELEPEPTPVGRSRSRLRDHGHQEAEPPKKVAVPQHCLPEAWLCNTVACKLCFLFRIQTAVKSAPHFSYPTSTPTTPWSKNFTGWWVSVQYSSDADTFHFRIFLYWFFLITESFVVENLWIFFLLVYLFFYFI